jgi:hypothetical protein
MMGRMGWIGCNRSDVMDCGALNSGGSDVMEQIEERSDVMGLMVRM